MIVLLIVGQILLVHWRKKSPKSYNMVTLILLWTTPLIASVYYGWYRFVTIWTIFSIIVGHPVRKAVWSSKVKVETPRVVYWAAGYPGIPKNIAQEQGLSDSA